jgi:hypothetical protein
MITRLFTSLTLYSVAIVCSRSIALSIGGIAPTRGDCETAFKTLFHAMDRSSGSMLGGANVVPKLRRVVVISKLRRVVVISISCCRRLCNSLSLGPPVNFVSPTVINMLSDRN